jgi:hypothetical protein
MERWDERGRRKPAEGNGWTLEQAVAEINAGAGRLLDPQFSVFRCHLPPRSHLESGLCATCFYLDQYGKGNGDRYMAGAEIYGGHGAKSYTRLSLSMGMFNVSDGTGPKIVGPPK